MYVGFAGGDQSFRGLGDGEDLLRFGIVGHAQVIDEVNSQDIVVKVYHKGSRGMPAFVGGRKSVDPLEFKVVISDSNYVGLVIETIGF